MITIFDKGQIIRLKEKGLSNRTVAIEVAINRKTVAKIWNKHLLLIESLNTNLEINKVREIQEEIMVKPSYNSSNRRPRKFNDEMETIIDELLEKVNINKEQIVEFTTHGFIHENKYIIIRGSSGVGKTHLATSLGISAAKKMSTYFIKCHDLISQFKKAKLENRLDDRIKHFKKYRLLIIDEKGYLPIEKEDSKLFFRK